MKKCGWKEVLVDGEPEKYVKTGLKFCPCKNFNGIIYWQYFGGEKRYICSACHGDTRKPEEEKPLIVPSSIKCGIYIVCWKSGGSSIASIGMMANGGRWIAPINWVRTSEDQDIFNDIERLKRIDIDTHKLTEAE